MSNQGLQKMAQTIGGTITKNSPTILTILGVTGVFSTAVMAVSATPKALSIIEEIDEEDRTKKEIIKRTYKCYVPAALMGAVTIGCIIGANSINLRRNAAIAGAYSIAEKALNEYQSKVIEVIGEKKHREVKDEMAKDKLKRTPVSGSEVIITGTGETLCYDALSGRYFKSDAETIKRALNKLSRDLMTEMFVSLNDVYYELGLEGTKLGDMMGWHVDQVGNDLINPNFSSQLADDGRPCLVLDFEVQPLHYDRNY